MNCGIDFRIVSCTVDSELEDHLTVCVLPFLRVAFVYWDSCFPFLAENLLQKRDS